MWTPGTGDIFDHRGIIWTTLKEDSKWLYIPTMKVLGLAVSDKKNAFWNQPFDPVTYVCNQTEPFFLQFCYKGVHGSFLFSLSKLYKGVQKKK